jgi:hypothetical protein
MDDNRILVDTVEAAELLSISPRQVYVLAAKGRLLRNITSRLLLRISLKLLMMTW